MTDLELFVLFSSISAFCFGFAIGRLSVESDKSSTNKGAK